MKIEEAKKKEDLRIRREEEKKKAQSVPITLTKSIIVKNKAPSSPVDTSPKSDMAALIKGLDFCEDKIDSRLSLATRGTFIGNNGS